jgi:hypothetical protein
MTTFVFVALTSNAAVIAVPMGVLVKAIAGGIASVGTAITAAAAVPIG